MSRKLERHTRIIWVCAGISRLWWARLLRPLLERLAIHSLKKVTEICKERDRQRRGV